jgi:hypothetical protein
MPEFTFQEEGHIYRLDGHRIISTTQALDILDDRQKDPYYLERGRLVHLATEYLDRDELDGNSLDPQISGYVAAYVGFKLDTGFIPTHIEHKLFHPKFMYAGRLDRIGPLNNCFVIIDLKSGAKAPKVDPLQGASYFELAIANKIPVKKIFDLYLDADGTYKLEPINNPKLLLPIFLNCLQITRWKETP